MRRSEEIRKEILANKTQEMHNATIIRTTENEVMVAELILLRQLNKKLQDKSQLLYELLDMKKRKRNSQKYRKILC